LIVELIWVYLLHDVYFLVIGNATRDEGDGFLVALANDDLRGLATANRIDTVDDLLGLDGRSQIARVGLRADDSAFLRHLAVLVHRSHLSVRCLDRHLAVRCARLDPFRKHSTSNRRHDISLSVRSF